MQPFISLIILVFVTVSSSNILPDVKQHVPLIPVMPLEELEGRITNGEIAKRGQFPYQVGLSLIYGIQRAWCGGTLLDSRWILTAAHCTLGADGVTVYLGAFDIKNSYEEGQQRIYVSKKNIHVHEGYNPPGVGDDISLIKLPVEIEFNDFVQPAVLPKKSGKYSTYEGDIVCASGWGRESDEAEGVSQFLRFIEVPILKQSTCNTYFLGQITNEMICIKTKGKKSTCNGDSGGPLIYKDNDLNTVIGVTSFGITLGCEKGWPGVFTRVTAYLDWIEEKSGIVNK